MVRPTNGQVSLNCHRDDQKDAAKKMMMVHDDHNEDALVIMTMLNGDVGPCTKGDSVEWIVDVGEDMQQVCWVKLPCK